MNKRQRKKKQKKYLPIFADEGNLLTMTKEEQQKAWEEYNKFKERHAYRKKYKDLKNGKALQYYFPVGQSLSDFMSKINRKINQSNGKHRTVTQRLDNLLYTKNEKN